MSQTQDLSRDQLCNHIKRAVESIGCKLQYYAGSEGSLYFRVVTACEHEFRMIDKLRISDHTNQAHDRQPAEENFIEGTDCDSDIANMLEYLVRDMAECRAYQFTATPVASPTE